MKKKKELMKYLKDMLDESPEMIDGKPHEVIYKIDDLYIYGGFCDGIRGVDHNCLKPSNCSWEDIFSLGTLSVPETRVYVSEYPVPYFEDLGFERMRSR